MNADELVTLSLEGAFSVLILTIAYKIYRSKIKTHSGCCLDKGNDGKNGFTIDTQNSGVSSENDIISKI
jgi:hypothetical protein